MSIMEKVRKECLLYKCGKQSKMNYWLVASEILKHTGELQSTMPQHIMIIEMLRQTRGGKIIDLTIH